MNHQFVWTENRPTMSGGLIEAIWETLVVLAVAAAISIGLISLSTHLNETQIARASGVEMAQAAAKSMPSGPAKAAAIDIE
jgi:hypothetical protein